MAVIPQEYQEVEYLESSGTQYIQTDVIPSNTIGFDCVYYTKSDVGNTAGAYGCIFGGRYSSGNNDFQFTTYRSTTSNKGTLRFGGSNTEYNAGITKEAVQSASLRNLQFTNGFGDVISIDSYNWTSNAKPITLFILYNGSSVAQGGSGCRIYEMRFYNGNDLIREYVPCYRKSDDEPGMYDTVSGTFFTNAGTGEFTLGPDVTRESLSMLWLRRRMMMKTIQGGGEIPSAYQKVEYIRSTGTQYFDTGISPTLETELILDFGDFDNNNNEYAPPFGLQKTGSQFATYSANSTRIYASFGNKVDVTYLTTKKWHSNRITLSMSKNGVYEDGVQMCTFANPTFASTSDHIYVFARLNNSGVVDRMSIFKLYSMQIKNNDVLVRNFIPCYRKSDNEAGIYDTVSGTFFTNAGTGAFDVGQNVNG